MKTGFGQDHVNGLHLIKYAESGFFNTNTNFRMQTEFQDDYNVASHGNDYY